MAEVFQNMGKGTAGQSRNQRGWRNHHHKELKKQNIEHPTSNAERRRGRREVSTEANGDNEEKTRGLKRETRDAKGVCARTRNFANTTCPSKD
jgi:hypothetical protein